MGAMPRMSCVQSLGTPSAYALLPSRASKQIRKGHFISDSVIPSEVGESGDNTLWQFYGILRLRSG